MNEFKGYGALLGRFWISRCLFAAAILVTAAAFGAEDAIDGGAAERDDDLSLFSRLSLNAFADVETAYLCRGYIYDTRPYSAQFASVGADLAPFGILEASVWTYSALSPSGHSANMGRYAYAEADYRLRYYYDIDIAEDWRLRNGLGKQWVTNPGFCGGRSVVDWQALQTLHTPWIEPYWRLRVIRRPFDELYWVVGAKRSFDILENLTFTADFFGDIGDRRQLDNLYGGWADANRRRLRGCLHALSLVLRLDYMIVEHVSAFAFVGQFCVVGNDARDAMKARKAPEGKRDLAFGGAGVAVDF